MLAMIAAREKYAPMTKTFEPTKKTGRHIYRVFGKATYLRHLDGRAASETEANAMAQGYIPSKPEAVEEQVATIETNRDTDRAIGNAFSKWTMTAKPWQYGAFSEWQHYEVRRS